MSRRLRLFFISSFPEQPLYVNSSIPSGRRSESVKDLRGSTQEDYKPGKRIDGMAFLLFYYPSFNVIYSSWIIDGRKIDR